MSMNDLHLRYVKPDWYVAKVRHGERYAMFFGTPMWITANYEKWRNAQTAEAIQQAAVTYESHKDEDHETFPLSPLHPVGKSA